MFLNTQAVYFKRKMISPRFYYTTQPPFKGFSFQNLGIRCAGPTGIKGGINIKIIGKTKSIKKLCFQ
jgi:hypothetical protein